MPQTSIWRFFSCVHRARRVFVGHCVARDPPLTSDQRRMVSICSTWRVSGDQCHCTCPHYCWAVEISLCVSFLGATRVSRRRQNKKNNGGEVFIMQIYTQKKRGFQRGPGHRAPRFCVGEQKTIGLLSSKRGSDTCV